MGLNLVTLLYQCFIAQRCGGIILSDGQGYDSLTPSNKSNIGLRERNEVLTLKVYEVRT